MIELLVVIAVIAVLIAILLPALASARRAAQKIECQAHLGSRRVSLGLYANGNDGAIAAFDWKPGVVYNPAYGAASTQQEAAAHQIMTLLGDVFGRDLAAAPPGVFPYPAGYHVLLRDYAEVPLFDQTNACPGDRLQQQWLQAFRDDPSGKSFLDLAERPFSPLRLDVVLAAGLNTMYFMVESAYSADRSPTVSSGATHLSWVVPPDARLGGRRVSQVAFPSSKVWLYEYQDQHAARSPQHFAYPTSKCNVLMFDGSVSFRQTQDAQPGWDPAQPDSGGPTEYTYAPEPSWEQPPANGAAGDTLLGWYRFTERGLSGIDF